MSESTRQPDKATATANARRTFLKGALKGAAAAALVRPAQLLGQAVRPNAPVSTTASPLATPMSRPSVVQISDRKLLPVRIVQRSLLKDYLSEGLRLFTGERTTPDAWHKILKPDDIVLLKFNQSGARNIGTTPPLATELVDSLIKAGWSPEQLILLEESEGLRRHFKTRSADYRWQEKTIDFGRSGKDSFIAALDQATAIINVPFLKTHHLATMTCCLKNLSHGLIQHPARFHTNGCDPAIGEIVASPPISTKLKLNVVNGLRVLFDRGPEAGNNDMTSAGMLLIGRDPVACDSVGYGILNEIRSLHQLKPLLPSAAVPRQLVTAARLGVGQFDTEAIDLQKLSA